MRCYGGSGSRPFSGAPCALFQTRIRDLSVPPEALDGASDITAAFALTRVVPTFAEVMEVMAWAVRRVRACAEGRNGWR